MPYLYFFAFNHSTGHGDCTLKLNQHITSKETLDDVRTHINQDPRVENVTILNWKFMQEIPEQENTTGT